MRILAIRGCNLASLGGEFALELMHEPLASAGLFAITGPTGSGKSTLLDALCLALFDKTPRLQHGRGYRFAGDQRPDDADLLSADVRNVLRRGAAEGRAEVDFRGVDGKPYRAVWNVWRARRRPEGRLQEQTMGLTDLESGMEIGHANKTETLQVIRDKLGMDFDQFSRSVVLAQGEFAAFLKADAKTRSGLLERLTGTEIYSRISQLAFERAKAEREACDRMTAELEALATLSDEARAELEQRRDGAEANRKTLLASKEQVKRDLQWHQDLEKWTKDVAEAEAALKTAESTWAELTEKRRTLERAERAAPLRGALEALDRARQDAAANDKRLIALKTASQEAEKRLTEAREALTAAREALTRARDEAALAKPGLERARGLDGELASLARQETECRAKLDAAATALEQAEGERQGLVEKIQSLETKRDAIDAWLAEHEADRSLAEDWGLWSRELERFADLSRKQAETSDAIAALADSAKTAQADLERPKAEMSRIKADSDRLAQAAAEAEAAAGAFDRPALERERDHLDAVDRVLERCLTLASAQADSGRERAELASQEKEARTRATEIDERLRRLEGEKAETAARLAEAQAALNRLSAALDLAQRRDELLSAGAPCPLCGSTEHPYRDHGGPADEAHADQKARVETLRDAERKLGQEEGRLQSERENLAQRIEAAVDKLAALDEADTRRRAAWDEACKELTGLDPELRLDFEPEAAARAREAGEAAIAQLRRRQNQTAEAETASRQARAKASEAAVALAGLERTIQEKDKAATRAVDQLASAREQADGLTAERDKLLASLAPILTEPASSARLKDDSAAFLAAARDRAEGWRAKSAERDEVENEWRELQAARRAADERVQERRNTLAPMQAQATEIEKNAERLKTQRAALFAGRTVAEVEAALETAANNAETALEQRRQAAEEAERDAALAVDRLKEAQAKAEELAAAEPGLARRLNDALAKADLDEATLRDWLAPEPDELERLRAELKAASEERTQRKAVLEERRTRLQAHGESSRPKLDREACSARLGEMTGELETLEEAVHGARVGLARDDEARRGVAEKAPRLAEQRRQAELWEEMNRMIGSAGGHKLRNYAQSLTLDALAALADAHLQGLEPRYRLERVPGDELELRVIDRYMGDEPRSLASLSGGETFLASLALALALSSLSASQARIGSLFIDEGFSSLDAETLDQALAVLDALQATGRQVGLISHVALIAERVGVRVQLRRGSAGASTLEVIAD